ncbi:MAG: prolipoprotein diacylglyceryl transferase [Lachnospiraceae bacterium]|nr:prolipoprotein diacylglyceryl transferase [Lachnospiraceae bacterium]
MLPFITVFDKFKMPLYGPVFLIGLIIAIAIAIKIAPKYDVSREDMLFTSILAAVGMFVGAKILFFITKLPDIIDNFDKLVNQISTDINYVVNYAFGGLVFYGGLIGAILAAFWYCKRYDVNFLGVIDIYAPLIPLVHAFGRVGCFLAGCCYGVEYHGFLAVEFPYNEMVPELNEVPRFPVQLVEAGLNLILFIVLFTIMKKKKLKPGRALGIYLIYYTIIRYILEMLRGDVIRGGIGIFSTSQIISIILLPIGIILVRGKWIKNVSQND